MNCGARLVAAVDAEPPELPEEEAPASPPPTAEPAAAAEPPVAAEPMAAAEPPVAAEPVAAAEPPVAAEPAAAEPVDDTGEPDWLRALRANPEAPVDDTTNVLLADSDLPEWLRTLTKSAASDAPAVESLDWGRDVSAEPFAQTEKDEPASSVASPVTAESVFADSAEADSLPAWLAELGTDAAAAQAPSAAVAPISPGEIPAWLSGLGRPPATTEPVTAVSESEVPGLQPSESPEWLKNLAPAQPAASAGSALSDVAMDELPEWLRPAAPASAPAGAESAPPAAPTVAETAPPTGLMPGEIPSWIQVLKPGALSTLAGESLETSGLLAGVHGALPVESAVRAPHTRMAPAGAGAPAPITGFSELSMPQAVPPPAAAEPAAPPKQRSGCLRLWLFLVIVAVAAFPFLPLPLVSEVRGANITGHQSTLDFYQTINQVSALRPGSLVLLGMDYGAGARGELDPQARAAVLHLLQNKQRIVTASFVPDGGQLAQDALNSGSPAATSFNYPYAYGVTHVNAGYLSGGAAAMRNLAQNGLPAAGADFGGRPLAGLQLTVGFKSAKAVDLIIVFTDDGAQLKHWIEQVVRDGGTPMVAGVSAATEPVAAPYYDSGQLKGLLVGQRGAAEYEGYLGRPASASASLDAISYVALVLVLVIAGALVVRLLSRPASA